MTSAILSKQAPWVAFVFLALGVAGIGNVAVAETPVINETQKLLPTDKGAEDYFGSSADLDGDTAIIGATGSEGDRTNTGAAYVFKRVAGVWAEQAMLLPSTPARNDMFGSSVALDGDTALVGAPNKGAVYFFTNLNGVWTQQAKRRASDKHDWDYFGSSVALDGDIAVIGAPQNGSSGLVYNGAAYVFIRVGGVWSQQAKLMASDRDDHDWFGGSVTLDGDTIVIGAGGQDNGIEDQVNQGAAYVFTRVGEFWTEQAKLLASDRADRDAFGVSVALVGDTVLISAPDDDDSGTTDNGAVYVFSRNRGVWTEQAKLLASDRADRDAFGVSLDFDGDRAIIGAQRKGESGTTGVGAAYVFVQDGGVWTEQAKLLASDRAGGDGFGNTAALDRDAAIIGASYKDDSGANDSGAAYVFSLAPDTAAVEVNIKPWSDRNLVDPGSTRLVPVAIHGDVRFDALQCDLKSLRLSPGDAEARNYRVMDVNRDGYIDLLAYFRSRDIQVGCGTTEMELTGRTHQGMEMHGSDTVTNMRCP